LIKEHSLKIALAILWALVVLVLLGFGLKLLRDLVLVREGTSSFPSLPTAPTLEERDVAIYFADEDASKLVPETRRARLGAGTSADAEAILTELIKGPQSEGCFSTIPADTRLINAYELDGTLVLDFTHELQTNHPGGSTAELLTAYSIVTTVTENIRGVKRVQLLVEGKEVETLAGHLDLTKPLSPSAKWISGWPR